MDLHGTVLAVSQFFVKPVQFLTTGAKTVVMRSLHRLVRETGQLFSLLLSVQVESRQREVRCFSEIQLILRQMELQLDSFMLFLKNCESVEGQ